MEQDVLRRIEKHGIVAIIRNIQKETLDEVVEALHRGGVSIVEVTCNTPGYLAMIERLSQRWSQSMLVGAGTVIDTVLAREVISAGARFLLAPNLDEEVIAIAAEHDTPIIPGVMSPTEAVKAHRLGAAMVKLFPAGILGAAYLKQLRGPLNQIKFMPVGGINIQNMPDFLKAGACAFGIGSELVDNSLVKQGRFAEIQRRAQQYTEIVAAFSE